MPRSDSNQDEQPVATTSVRKLADHMTCSRAAELFRALGEPSRLQILATLLQGECSVSELAQQLQDSVSSVSQRLKTLRTERIVNCRREGKKMIYFLADEQLGEMVARMFEHVVKPVPGMEIGRIWMN